MHPSRQNILPRPSLPIIVLAGLNAIAGVSAAHADGSSVGQIYSPYVQPLEQEIELVGVYDARADNGNIPSSRWQKIGYGTSLSEGVYTELSFTNLVRDGEDHQIVELENIWQITEQGEYDSDWGMLFELETDLSRSSNEAAVGILNSRDFGRYTLVTNAIVAVEWGDDIKDEVETALAIQGRYRMSRSVEPSIELFVGQDTLSVGPGLTGIWRLTAPNQLRWNIVALAGLDDTSEYSLKIELEYEFF